MNASVAIQVLPTLPDKELVPVVDKVIEYIDKYLLVNEFGKTE